jgi:hypothetical protein
VKVYLAVSPEAYNAREAAYNQRYALFKQYFAWLACSVIVFAAGFIWLMATAGRRPDGGEIKTGAADTVYLDIGFLLMLAGVALLLLLAYAGSGSLYAFFYTPRLGVAGVFCMGAAVAGIVSLILLWSTSLARRIRKGDAGAHTLCYAIFGGVRKLYAQADVTAQAGAGLVFYVLAGLAAAIVLAAGAIASEPVPLAAGLVLAAAYVTASLRYVLRKARVVREIEKGVDAIKNGAMDYAIPAEGDTPLGRIADGVNNIAEGLSAAVKKEVRAERMKTELITNISHDVKTPLTSILTYVDLLKKEQGLSAEAQKYIDVLDVKSNRL